MAYVPPTGNAVNLDFVSGYTPPGGVALNLEFSLPPNYVLGVTLGDQSSFGVALVVTPQAIAPTGWTSATFGGHSIDLFNRYLTLAGWTSSTYGTPDIVNTAQAVLPGGIAPPPDTGPSSDRQVPTPRISFWVQYALPPSITPPAVPEPIVTPDIQYVPLTGVAPGSVGSNTFIDFAVRTVVPPFITSSIFGIPNIAFVQSLLPSGWESSTVSVDAQLDINLQRLFPDSGATDPASYGATQIRNEFEHMRPQGWASSEINFPVVYNQTQYILAGPFADADPDPTEWPNYAPFVENVNRTLGPSSWISSRFSVIGNIIENAADPLYPTGLDSLEFGSGTFIAYRNREVAPAGWDSFYSSQYTVVHNDARVVTASGWASSVVGTPSQVLNLDRTVIQHSGYAGGSFGTAFIADAVRNVAPHVFNDVPAGIPEVRFNPYPLAPTGIVPGQSGGHFVYEHFTIVSPYAVNVFSYPRVGEPFIQNRNKELRPFGHDSALFGTQRVFNHDQYFTVSGSDTSVFGGHVIAYRTRTMVTATITAPGIVSTHQIRNDTPDPPGQQYAIVEGISPPGPSPTPHTISLRTLFPEGIGFDNQFGVLTARSNGIFPIGMIPKTVFGIPSIPFTRYIFAPTLHDEEYIDTQVGRDGRLSPFNIYAPRGEEKPLGYHPDTLGQFIDASSIIGQHSISNFNRSIGPAPDHNNPYSTLEGETSWGTATLTLRLQYVYAVGIRSLRMGLPVLWGVPQYIEFGGEFGVPGIGPDSVVGEHTVEHYVLPMVNRTVRPVGTLMSEVPSPRVELFNRVLTLTGIPHRGNPEQFMTSPWGVPNVGPTPRIYPTLGSQTLWGTAYIDFKNRPVYPEGWNSLSLENFDPTEFDLRMRVTRRNPLSNAMGIAPGDFGIPTVMYKNRTVYGRPIANTSYGTPIVSSRAYLLPTGWDSLVVGDIDEWEPDKIKPHGDDMSDVGYPRMMRGVDVSGVAGGSMGEARVGQMVYVWGMPPVGFDGPSITNPDGCSTRVVSTLPVLSTQVVATPSVT